MYSLDSEFVLVTVADILQSEVGIRYCAHVFLAVFLAVAPGAVVDVVGDGADQAVCGVVRVARAEQDCRGRHLLVVPLVEGGGGGLPRCHHGGD